MTLSDCCHSTWDLEATGGGGGEEVEEDEAPWQQVKRWLL